jgi:hypothetical protein
MANCDRATRHAALEGQQRKRLVHKPGSRLDVAHDHATIPLRSVPRALLGEKIDPAR